MKIQTINPATEEVLNSYDCLTDSLIDTKIKASHEAFLSWKKSSFAQRKSLMSELALLLEEKKEELAILMAQEMGKPITAGKAEIDKCAWVCEHYAEQAETYLASNKNRNERVKVCYRALWSSVCYHALEFSILAGFSFCSTNHNGWKCRNFKTCSYFFWYWK